MAQHCGRVKEMREGTVRVAGPVFPGRSGTPGQRLVYERSPLCKTWMRGRSPQPRHPQRRRSPHTPQGGNPYQPRRGLTRASSVGESILVDGGSWVQAMVASSQHRFRTMVVSATEAWVVTNATTLSVSVGSEGPRHGTTLHITGAQ